ncbi:MAG: glycosyltransferase family 4 protein [Planctomycetota bacterium]|jgi:glycosyltransferase involved in cell wall biosynthesis
MAAEALSVVYSVPGRLGVGGMGRGALASVRAALSSGWSVRVISAPGGETPAGVEAVPVESGTWLPLARCTPARFSPAWLCWVAERTHDLRAARAVGAPQLFQGAGHCCLASMRAARRAGAVTVVESMNAHARHVDRVMRAEERSAGSRAHFHTGVTVARCEAEYREADYVYCNSSYTRRTLIEGGVPEAKVITVPLPVELPDRVARHEDVDRFRVLFVGMLDLRKGFRHLLSAWKGLAPDGAELYLRGGTGDRPCRRILAEWRERMEFTVDASYGPVPYHEFSVLVLPSISDGFGLVVTEAMAAGLPVVITENVGAADCVREGTDGFVVPPGDADALAERLGLLHADRDRLISMGRAARERAAEFSPEAFRERYASAVRRAVK